MASNCGLFAYLGLFRFPMLFGPEAFCAQAGLDPDKWLLGAPVSQMSGREERGS